MGSEIETPQHLVATLNDYRPSELVAHIEKRDAAIRHQALVDAMRAVDSEISRSGYAGIACAAIGKLLEKTGDSDGD